MDNFELENVKPSVEGDLNLNKNNMKKSLITILIIVIIGGVGYFTYSKDLINLDFLNNDNAVNGNKQENIIKPEEPKDKYVINYKDEEYKVKQDTTDNYIVCKRNIPIITNQSNRQASYKITNSLMGFSNRDWKSLKESCDENSDLTYEDIGVSYIMSTGIITDGRLTFTVILDGGFGGVSWRNDTGYNYDAKTGELLTLINIGSNNNEVKNIVKKHLFSSIEKKYNDKNSCIYDEWRGDLEKDFDNYSWYFTSEGIKIIIPKYGIACGAGGVISTVVDKNLLNSYLKDEYKF